MGLASYFVELGIRAEQAATALSTFSGQTPLSWPAGDTGSLIWRLPRDAHQRASIFSKSQTILVNEGEIALVIEDGRSHGHLEPGRYVFEKRRVTGALDVVWTRTGQQALKWGVGNVTSADHVQITANGMLYVRVGDAQTFNRQIVQGAITLPLVELQRTLMPRLQGVLRTVITRYAALDLQTQREVFANAIRASLVDTFTEIGISIVDVEVVEIGLPAEFKAVIQEATLAQHAGRANLIQASTAAQVMQLEAQAAAQAFLMQGQAQVQVMAQMQSHGIDPLRYKALEALEVMAEHPTQGGLIGGDGGRANLFSSVAMAAMANAPTTVPPVAPVLLGAGSPPFAAAAPAVSQESAAAPAGDTIPDLQRQLDALDERMAEGKISEETYKKISSKLEARMAKLT